MFSPELKRQIADAVKGILLETHHPELPEHTINFLLHVDGKEMWSWANICNNEAKIVHVPESLVKNTTVTSSD